MLETAAKVAGLTGLVGALLFYFGWSRSAATFGYFGIELDVLDLSFRDYVLRSVQSAYWPATVALLLTLVALLANGWIRSRAPSSRLEIVFVAGGSVLVLAGGAAVAKLYTLRTTWPVVPVLLLSGTLLITYGLALRGARVGRDSDAAPGSPTVRGIRRAVVGTLLLLLTFWTVSTYASHHGRQVAESVAADLRTRPAVVVLSERSLRLPAPGVTETRIGDDASRFRFCYSGLRLLIRSGGRYFLAPEGWRRGVDPVIVVPESDDLAFEFLTPYATPSCTTG